MGSLTDSSNWKNPTDQPFYWWDEFSWKFFFVSPAPKLFHDPLDSSWELREVNRALCSSVWLFPAPHPAVAVQDKSRNHFPFTSNLNDLTSCYWVDLYQSNFLSLLSSQAVCISSTRSHTTKLRWVAVAFHGKLSTCRTRMTFIVTFGWLERKKVAFFSSTTKCEP